MKTLVSTAARVAAGMLASSATLQAALFVQTNLNPNNSNLWNNSAVWGGNAVGPGNDYQSATGANLGTSFTVNGTIWNFSGHLRDTAGNAPANTAFAGDQLILVADSRLLMKGRGTTSTANIVMQNDSHIILAPDGNGIATLAGTISIADGGLMAIGIQPNGGNTLNVGSTLLGGIGSTLQLVLHGGSVNHLNVDGDFSGFAGTFFVGTSTVPTGAGSSFSFAAGSAPLATLHLTTHANFAFNLDTALTFGSVILGADTVLDPGTYDFDDLSGLGFGSSFTSNGGSLTVIPEPSAMLLGGIGMLCLLRTRRSGAR